MTKAVILHGTGSDSESNWFEWLRGELEKRGWEAWVPDLPEAERPSIRRYNEFLLGSGFPFDEETVLIGHSSGAVAILGLLQGLPEGSSVDVCYLVGSFRGDLGWDNLGGMVMDFDFELIRSRASRFVFVHSDDDPYCPLEHAEGLCEQVGGELRVIPGRGHFMEREFPELLEMVGGE